jgi:hypothetical protein
MVYVLLKPHIKSPGVLADCLVFAAIYAVFSYLHERSEDMGRYHHRSLPERPPQSQKGSPDLITILYTFRVFYILFQEWYALNYCLSFSYQLKSLHKDR